MNSIASLDDTKQAALLKGVALLSRVYWGPDEDSSRDLLRGTYLKPFEALKPIIDEQFPGVISEMEAINTSFMSKDEIFRYLEQTYINLFINSHEGITAPLYASCYSVGSAPEEDAPLMGPPAASMKERIESKGLSLGGHIHEPPDHLSIELEYLYFLLERGWSDDDPVLQDEAASFAGDIMLPSVIKFQERLEAVQIECRFYQRATAILCAILRFIGTSNKDE